LHPFGCRATTSVVRHCSLGDELVPTERMISCSADYYSHQYHMKVVVASEAKGHVMIIQLTLSSLPC